MAKPMAKRMCYAVVKIDENPARHETETVRRTVVAFNNRRHAEMYLKRSVAAWRTTLKFYEVGQISCVAAFAGYYEFRDDENYRSWSWCIEEYPMWDVCSEAEAMDKYENESEA